jgi:hypothetical protein
MRLRKKEFNDEVQTSKICFSGELLQKLPQREFPSQTTPFYNFLMTRPIHKNCNLIDAAWRVQHHTKLRHVKKFDPEEQFSRKFPQREFPSHNQDVLTTFERMEIDEKCQRKEIGIGESNGDVTSGLRRHLAAKRNC